MSGTGRGARAAHGLLLLGWGAAWVPWAGCGGDADAAEVDAAPSSPGPAVGVLDAGATPSPGATTPKREPEPAPPPAPADPTRCATVLRVTPTISIPTVWKNGPGDCDVYLDGVLTVESSLTIEPGTVIRLAMNASIHVANRAFITAVGRPDARIRFLGMTDVRGFWNGLNITGGEALTRIEHTDIQNAGQTGSVKNFAAIKAGASRLAFKHNRVSKSFVDGAVFWAAELTEFEDNVFEDNGGFGLVIEPDQVARLDTASDYVGRSRPNDKPYIKLYDYDLQEPGTWRDCGTPYYAWNSLSVDAPLTLEPGVEIVVEAGKDLRVSGTGSLTAVGTAALPIVFSSTVPTPGAWRGLRFFQRPTSAHRLEHVRVEYAGQKVVSPEPAAIESTGTGGTLGVTNTTIVDSAGVPLCSSAGTTIALGAGVRAVRSGVASAVSAVARCQ